jgi:cbb3-type cytochrome oxidase cytochrome c subunit
VRLIIVLLLGVLVGCTDVKPVSKMPTYEELVDYPADCEKSKAQLEQLRYIQTIKNFNPDPDKLNENDRAYNSRLKATIWWYTYRCEQ